MIRSFVKKDDNIFSKYVSNSQTEIYISSIVRAFLLLLQLLLFAMLSKVNIGFLQLILK